MARCPRCAKRFKDEKRVLRHMNQPRVSCINFLDDLVDVSHILRPRTTGRHTGRLGLEVGVRSKSLTSVYPSAIDLDDRMDGSNVPAEREGAGVTQVSTL